MLSYATVGDFRRIKYIRQALDDEARANLRYYLRAATDVIDTLTARTFHPYYAAGKYLIPSEYVNLRLRQYPSADLVVDDDLLEVISLTTGDPAVAVTDYELLPLNTEPRYGIRLTDLAQWGGNNTAFVSSDYKTPSIFVEGLWGYHERYSRSQGAGFTSAWSDPGFTLPDTLSDSDATITLPGVGLKDMWGAVAVEAGMLLRVANELMAVIDVTETGGETVVSVLRGAQGSTPVAHDAGAKVSRWQAQGDIVEACFMIAKQWREHDEATGGRQGVSEMSIGVEMNIPGDAMKLLMRYRRSTMGRTN